MLDTLGKIVVWSSLWHLDWKETRMPTITCVITKRKNYIYELWSGGASCGSIDDPARSFWKASRIATDARMGSVRDKWDWAIYLACWSFDILHDQRNMNITNQGYGKAAKTTSTNYLGTIPSQQSTDLAGQSDCIKAGVRLRSQAGWNASESPVWSCMQNQSDQSGSRPFWFNPGIKSINHALIYQSCAARLSCARLSLSLSLRGSISDVDSQVGQHSELEADNCWISSEHPRRPSNEPSNPWTTRPCLALVHLNAKFGQMFRVTWKAYEWRNWWFYPGTSWPAHN